MNPAGRIAAAIDVLSDVETRHRPIADALRDWGMSHRFAGVKDRAAIGNLAYDALRRRRSFAFAMGADTPRALALAAFARSTHLDATGIADLVGSAPHAPPPLTPDEIAGLAKTNLAEAPDPVRADVPDWLVPSLRRVFADDWVDEAAALAERPPLDLRVNRLKADRPKVLAALKGAGVTRFSPDGIRYPPTEGDSRHPNVTAEPAFQKGQFEVQDEGSQLAALAVGAEPGMQVLDLCAGGGGKTLALAAVMANKGQIHATDADRQRLAPIFDRLRRAGTRNVQVHPAGAALDGLVGAADRVLVDAPCTGSGTWRRRPDAKWRLSERALAERIAEQAALLSEAAGYVKAGGLLVYVTCSVLPEENAEQVAAFLVQRPDFAPVAADDLVAGAGLAAEAAGELAAAVLRPPVGLQLTPRRTGTDAFYVAALRRIG